MLYEFVFEMSNKKKQTLKYSDHLEYSDYYFHLPCHTKNVSDDVSFDLLSSWTWNTWRRPKKASAEMLLV